jgi:hypothetical protein
MISARPPRGARVRRFGLSGALCAAFFAGLAPDALRAQVLEPAATRAASAWNDPQVLRLVERARELRHSVAVDPDLQSYQAEARGHVYFFMDRPDSAEHVLIKGDQVALEVYWLAPDIMKQWIVGQRDEKLLPTSIRYHLDHLTVVQDDFGDHIRLGDGDEVEAVTHPVAPGAELVYDFLLSDSLTISYAGGAERIRVYEVRVRPKNLDMPGFVGTVFLDRDRAAIVRMNFSFTPESYVDPYLDYIRISMDNSLWMGRYWLPYRQEVEIRREMPVLDFQAGSTIRSQFDIRAYDFNVEIPPQMLAGPTVGAVSPAERQAFVFEGGIFDELEEEGGLGPSPSIQEVETQVREVVEDEVLSGLAPIRLHLARLSDFARYNRAEGLFVGGGLTLRPSGDIQMRSTAGYAVGRRRASGAVSLTTDRGRIAPALDAYWDAMGDIGGNPGATPLENTISSVSASEDFLDPYFRRGATLTFASRPRGPLSLSLRWEQHRSAQDVVSEEPDSDWRPVRSVNEGTMGSLTAELRGGLPGGGSATLAATGGRLGERNFAALDVEARWDIADTADRWSAAVSAEGGVTNPGAPAQTFYMIGGRHTLPGYGYRDFVGNAYWLLRTELTVPVRAPYVGIRAFSVLGASYLGDVSLPADWLVEDSDGVRASVGLGLSLGWDTMRLDLGRAVWGGGWEAVFSVAPRFKSWL